MSRFVEKVKTHLPGHHETSTFSQPPLTRTFHNENTSKGFDKVTYQKEDHFEGKNAHTEEKIIEKETIISDLPQKKESVKMPIEKKPTLKKEVPLVQPPVIQPPVVQQNVQTVLVDPIVDRSVVEKPVIVKERFVPEEMIEIQPIIHRDRELREVHEVVQPLKEREVMATKVVQATLANEIRAPIIESDANFQTQMREANTRFVPTTEYAPLKTETIQKPVIVQEHIHKTIVEEIQPILYKETVVPVLIKETQPIYEKIVEAPVIFNEQREVRELGTRFIQTSLNETQRGVELQNMHFDSVVYQNQTGFPAQSMNIAGQTLPQQQPLPGNKVYEKKVEIFEQKNPLQPNVSSTKLV